MSHQPPPSLLAMIGALIGAPSVSSVNPTWNQGNLGVIELLEHWLLGLDFRVEVLPIAGFPGKANLVATLGSGPGGLVLAGHTDTVPWDEHRWHSDPFTLREADNRLYGLGTCDMKAFLALAIEAARELRAGDLASPLIILATADEESSMCGARALADAGRPRARFAVIGEPTGLRPVRMHKGILMESIRVTGRSGHSSDPALGNNAMEGMHRVIGVLLDWRAELASRHRNEAFRVPVPTLNLGHIHGGDNPNRICAECELHIDLRPLPGMNLDALREDIERLSRNAVGDGGLVVSVEPLFEGIPAMETPADSELVRSTERLTGHPAEAVAFGTEAPYLDMLGMETVILGPGDIEQAHQPDEYLAMERINPTVDLLRALIRAHCTAA